MKKNCWEFKNCGREPDGDKVNELGVCSACAKQEANEINGGRNAGRICWAEAGTYCNGEIQGTFAQKQSNCMNCEFFKIVKEEEGGGFKLMIPGQDNKTGERQSHP